MKNIVLIILIICSINVNSQELQKRVDTINELVQEGNYEVALRKTNRIFNDGYKMSELYLLKAICLMEGNKLFIENKTDPTGAAGHSQVNN